MVSTKFTIYLIISQKIYNSSIEDNNQIVFYDRNNLDDVASRRFPCNVIMIPGYACVNWLFSLDSDLVPVLRQAIRHYWSVVIPYE